MLIELSHQDQVYIEEECSKHGYTYATFLIMLLDMYRNSLIKVPVSSEVETKIEPEIEESPKKRGRRPKKSDG